MNSATTPHPSTPSPSPASAVLSLKTILVPTDLSECSHKAIHYGQRLAQQFGASVTLLHVVEPVHTYPVDGLSTFPTEVGDLAPLPQATEDLKKFAASLPQEEAVPMQLRTRQGSAHGQIVKAAKEEDVDLIVISTHGRTGLDRVLIGSTAELVVRHAPCPVLVVREKEHDFA
jgi:nucleotide-binding universal stress UspA family protein